MSNFRLRLTSKVVVFIHFQVMVAVSSPSVIKRKSGGRLIKKASLTALVAWLCAQSFCGAGELSVLSRGRTKRVIVRSSMEVIIVVVCIAFTWICTKSFWLLRPMDDFYPLKARVSRGV